jgi:hypothetical protein
LSATRADDSRDPAKKTRANFFSVAIYDQSRFDQDLDQACVSSDVLAEPVSDLDDALGWSDAIPARTRNLKTINTFKK